MGGDYQAVVVGGGPAGATAAAVLARAGVRVACFERERFPRFHIGESLLPASLPLFDRIGVGERIRAAGFQRKNGAAFLDEAEPRQLLLNFRAGPTWADHAYNVPRADFDRLLLDHAAKAGADVFEGVAVREVALGPDGVRLRAEGDEAGGDGVRAEFLIDASGRDAFLASRLGRREPLPTLGKVALFAHYRGAPRWEGRLEGHIRIYLFPHGWFWWIPFAGDTTSVGCVLHQRVMRAWAGSRETLFETMVRAAPSVAAQLAGATRTTEVWSAANFSYRTTPAVGDRFVVVGDAVSFVDPIFSTGVYVAMQSAELAAAVVADRLRRGTFRAAAFDRYRRRIDAGTRLFFHYIDRYYDPSFLDVFFLPSPPAALREALITVLAGGAFLDRPLWLRLRLAVVGLRVAYARRARRRAGRPLESRRSW